MIGRPIGRDGANQDPCVAPISTAQAQAQAELTLLVAGTAQEGHSSSVVVGMYAREPTVLDSLWRSLSGEGAPLGADVGHAIVSFRDEDHLRCSPEPNSPPMPVA